MKIAHKVLASLMTFLAVCIAQAADSKPIARVIAISEIETGDASGYASWVSKTNEIIKAKLGIDTYYHVYVSTFDGEKSGSVRSVIAAESVAAMAKNTAAVAGEPALRDIQDHHRAIRKIGARVRHQSGQF